MKRVIRKFHLPALKSCLIFFVISLFSLSFFSCAQQSPTDSQSISSKSSKRIIVWHWMTDREDIFQELAKQYESLTGIRVTFELYAPSDAYSQKVRAAAQAQTLPDIYGILADKKDFAAFVKAGHVASLSEEMDRDNGAWRKKLFSKALAVSEFLEGNEFSVQPGIYGVSLDVMNIQMLYNKKLFAKAGLDPDRPPRTWEEFIEAGKKLKAAGIQGLVSGWGEVWMIDCFASNYAFNIMGEDKVLATIRGDVPYTDLDWVKVFSLFKELADEGVLANGIVTMINKTAEQNFANERAAFAFNGSWCVNVYGGMNPNLEYGVMLPPRASNKHPMMIWGGAGTSFMVNGRSQNKGEAIKFLNWLTEEKQQAYLAKKTNNPPSNRNCISGISDILSDFVKQMDQTTHPNIWPVHEFPVVIERLDKGIQSIIIGEKTPEQLSREIQAIKERELSKSR
ncbi:MAG: extracellular solute-binding protein [Candidatus Omnitrophica bacterium]|nr:extracellular solute-binding protein [Candidatus Omnitrophota bacterium]